MIQQTDGLNLSCQKREASGSKQAQRLRKTGWLPCVVYASTGNSFSIQTQRHPLELLLRKLEGQNLILDLNIEGDKMRKVLLKDMQRDHISDHLLHADFLEISMTRKLKLSVAVRLVGESVGVSQQGGVMEQVLRSVEVECLPSDIVKEFVLDVSALAIGDTLSARDLNADPKITILTPPDRVVVSVQLPHFEEEKPEEEAAEAAVEGQPVAEGAEAAAPAEPGKEKESKDKTKEAKEPESKEKGKESREKGKEPKKESKEKSKEPKEKAK